MKSIAPPVNQTDIRRVQSKLARGEKLVWIGRPVPSFRYSYWIVGIVVGVCLTIAMYRSVCFPALVGLLNGSGLDAEGQPLGTGIRLLFSVLMIPWFVVGPFFVLSPLFHYLWQQRTLYAVGDECVYIIGPFFRKRLRPKWVIDIKRTDRSNGLSTIFLRRMFNDCSNFEFENLPVTKADEAMSALRPLLKPFVKGFPNPATNAPAASEPHAEAAEGEE